MKQDKTNAEVGIGYFHHKIHHEKMFIVADVGTNIQIATPKLWGITTPNSTVLLHAMIALEADGIIKLQIYEAPTITGAGTGLTPLNMNRNSSKTSTAAPVKDMTVSANGTLVLSMVCGGTVGRASLFDLLGESEIVLKQNTAYLISATSVANGTNAYLNLFYYELDTANVGE